jgi:hypothetical protein
MAFVVFRPVSGFIMPARDVLDAFNFEVCDTCSRWRANLSPDPVSWDDGLDGTALCHALFDVGRLDGEGTGASGIRYRCGPQRDGAGRWMPYAQRAYCHQL